MKRFITATALSTLIATGALAQTATEEATIERYFPEIEASTLSATTIDQLMLIANGGSTESEKLAKMRALINDEGVTYTLSEAEMAEIMVVAPDIDFTNMNDAERAQAVDIVSGASSRGEAIVRLRSLTTDDTVVTTDMLTESEMVILNRYAPNVDISGLTEQELARLKSAIGSDNVSEIEAVVADIKG